MIEANPRASRTVPFVAKATGVPLAKVAARVMVGRHARRAAGRGPAAAAGRAAATSRSRRRCCRSTASPTPTPCSAPRCARPARSWASTARSGWPSPRARWRRATGCPTDGTVFLSLADRDKQRGVAAGPVRRARLRDRRHRRHRRAPRGARRRGRHGRGQGRRGRPGVDAVDLIAGGQDRPGRQHAPRAAGPAPTAPTSARRPASHRVPLPHHRRRRAGRRRGHGRPGPATSSRCGRCRSTTPGDQLRCPET